MAPIRNESPSLSQRLPNFAPQKRTAFSRTIPNTGARSPRDELMTSSTFEVAACCSCSSRISRLRWSSCWWRVGSRDPSTVLRCGRRLAVAGFLSRVPLRSPFTPPSRFNAAPGKKLSIFKPIAAWFRGVGNWAEDRPGICSMRKSATIWRAAPTCVAWVRLPHWEVANGRRVRLTRAGRYRIVVDGGSISNTLFLLKPRSSPLTDE